MPLFATWTELCFKWSIARHPEYCFCPRCGGVAIEDAEDNSADCAVCFFVFCPRCQESRHPGVECTPKSTRLETLRQRAAGGNADATALLEQAEQELQSLCLIEETTKRCPSCGEAVERSQGCNKMTCLCGAKFCFRCGSAGGWVRPFPVRVARAFCSTKRRSCGGTASSARCLPPVPTLYLDTMVQIVPRAVVAMVAVVAVVAVEGAACDRC